MKEIQQKMYFVRRNPMSFFLFVKINTPFRFKAIDQFSFRKVPSLIHRVWRVNNWALYWFSKLVRWGTIVTIFRIIGIKFFVLMFACKMSRELRIIYWMKIRPKKKLVTCLEKNGSVGPDNDFFSTKTSILAVITLHQHKFCVYKGR